MRLAYGSIPHNTVYVSEQRHVFARCIIWSLPDFSVLAMLASLGESFLKKV